ncbi:MAG TPA: hypothetical protein VFG10_09830 [Saprospiraceae bacterium]|nr:hypothetical protein [Saprospiraceae bacterium]
MTTKYLVLKNKDVVFCTGYNKEKTSFYGYNLSSPNLRVKSFSKSKIAKNTFPLVNQLNLVLEKLSLKEFYCLSKDNKFHKACTTRKRHEEILILLLNLSREDSSLDTYPGLTRKIAKLKENVFT